MLGVQVREGDDEYNRRGKECDGAKQATEQPKESITNEYRCVCCEGPENLPEGYSMDEFVHTDEAAFARELLLHQAYYGHSSAEADATDLQKRQQ